MKSSFLLKLSTLISAGLLPSLVCSGKPERSHISYLVLTFCPKILHTFRPTQPHIHTRTIVFSPQSEMRLKHVVDSCGWPLAFQLVDIFSYSIWWQSASNPCAMHPNHFSCAQKPSCRPIVSFRLNCRCAGMKIHDCDARGHDCYTYLLCDDESTF